jgi:hypothetical protein
MIQAVTIRKMAGNSVFGVIFIEIAAFVFKAGKFIEARWKGKNNFSLRPYAWTMTSALIQKPETSSGA